MKKIIALVLALALLPTFALAAKKPKATEPPAVPTFDFTAEEWLVRYQEVVGEDSEWWFEEFEEADSTPSYYYFRHEYENGNRIDLLSKKKDQNIGIVSVSVPCQAPEINEAAFTPSADALRSFAKQYILATMPALTDEDVDAIFSDLGMNIFSEAVFYAPKRIERHGLFFEFGAYPTNMNFSVSSCDLDLIYW